jgi:nicotinamide-nucleotide amidase
VTGGEAFDRRTAVEIAEAAQRLGVRVAVAESLTGGLLTARLAEAPEASTWLRGGVVAYHAEVKYHVLGVDPGPVVTAWAARQMARGVARLLGADVGISVTGVAARTRRKASRRAPCGWGCGPRTGSSLTESASTATPARCAG